MNTIPPRPSAASDAAPPSQDHRGNDGDLRDRFEQHLQSREHADAPPVGRETAQRRERPRDDPRAAADTESRHAVALTWADAHAPLKQRRERDDDGSDDGAASLQALLAAQRVQDASGSMNAAAAPAATTLTPHDVAATVSAAWVQDAPTALGALQAPQWTFALGDALTPLATLKVSGDASQGWALQITAGRQVPAQQLAARAERLRLRLVARGQAVHTVDVEDDEEAPQ